MAPSVSMYPAEVSRRDNPYITILTEALETAGVRTSNYRPWLSRRTQDILHVHWPERVFHTRISSRSATVAAYYASRLAERCREVRNRGGRVIWTAHNLHPHDGGAPAFQRIWDELEASFFPTIDTVIAMSDCAEEKVLAARPSLSGVRFRVAPHPHYRDFFKAFPASWSLRRRWRIPADAKVFAMVGQVRRYKGVSGAIAAFNMAKIPNSWLIVAGRIHRSCHADIRAALGSTDNIIVHDTHLSHEDIVAIYGGADIALFNFENIFNSGSVLTALSLGVPVLAPRLGTLPELQSLVGSEWLSLFAHPLTPDLLRGFAEISPSPAEGLPALDHFEPARVAELHRAIYNEI